MAQQLQWAAGKPSAYRASDWQARGAAYHGQSRRSAEYAQRAIAALDGEEAAEYAAEVALREAALGRCGEVKAASQVVPSDSDRSSLTRAALALAWCDKIDEAKPLIEELTRRYPQHTVVNAIWIPEIRAATALVQGRPEAAIDLLTRVAPYEAVAEFWPQFIRGQAYLRLGKAREAELEFRKILEHRGEDALSPLYPLAHLGLARAAAQEHDSAQARKAYEAFLAAWRDADSDLPALAEAKRELANGR
jgi:tetratricopeptide (TPR) repeat protein